MAENVLIFIFSIFLVVKGATLATKYSAKFAENLNVSKYVVGFIVVAFISILPETLISINSAIEKIPEFGLGTLFGSNVADLTLIFAFLILFARRGIRIKSRILKNVQLYPFFLLLPLIFGLNGYYSRIEGAALVIAGALFYYLVFKNGAGASPNFSKGGGKRRNLIFLLFGTALLLVGSHFTVTSAVAIANSLGITPILIGMLVVGLGTTLPELFYSLKAIKKKDDDLAIGDILGAVLADATIVVGLLAFISPFYFPVKIIYITGAFMLVASLILLNFMKTGRVITKKEGYILLAFWASYVIIEFIVSQFQIS